MYSIYINNGNGDTLIYSPTETMEGYVALEPILKTAINKASTLTFTLPPTNPDYLNIHKLKTTIKAYDGTTLLFIGRCRESTRDFNNYVDFECESAYSWLNDITIRPYTYTGTVSGYLSFIIGKYNDQAHTGRKISAGTVSSSLASKNVKIVQEDSAIVIDELEEGLLDNFGGTFRERVSGNTIYLDYLTLPTSVSPQVIEFGKNLLDFEQYIDATELFTRIYPYGKTTETGGVKTTVNISSVNGGQLYLKNDNAESTFGAVISTAVTWSDEESPSRLKAKAQAMLDASVSMATTFELTAIDLHLIDVDETQITKGTANHVISPPHQINTIGSTPYVCQSTTIYFEDASKNRYTFGQSRKTLTEKIKYTSPVLRGTEDG